MKHNEIFKMHELFENFDDFQGALVFDDWTQFIENCNEIKEQIPVDQACERLGINKDYFHKVVDHAFSSWRDSTSTSTLHGISYLKLGQIPPLDTPIFKDLMWQTRFLTVAIAMFRNVFLLGTKPVMKDGKPFMVKGTRALQADSRTITPANRILRCLYLYWWLNSLKSVKLPKRIYRGIRAHDLYRHENLEPLISGIWKADKSHEMQRKDAVDILIKWICERKLHEITDGNLLSFTASIPVAKYFSNGEGIIISIDPSKVQIITSELHDERLQGKDYLSNKQEKEYIVRIPPEYPFKPEDIIINDLDYFVAEQNPLAVALFDHDTKQAQYQINGVDITAWFSWRNNNSGSVIFQATSQVHGQTGTGWTHSRKEFMKDFGFDPLPTDKNLSEITNFVIKPRKNY